MKLKKTLASIALAAAIAALAYIFPPLSVAHEATLPEVSPEKHVALENHTTERVGPYIV